VYALKTVKCNQSKGKKLEEKNFHGLKCKNGIFEIFVETIRATSIEN
jgi:hypothetical protein